ncbi:MAG: 1-phosphofructokinase [Clostridiaceae bacterium]
MVITVTLNPAMDKTLIVDNYKLGAVNRTQSIRYDIGGKGINVSKVLINLGIKSTSTGFLGGIWKKTFEEELDKRDIIHKFINIDGNTRTNTKIVDNVNKVYTDLNEQGPIIDSKSYDKFLREFESMCNEGDIVVLSGGVSPNISEDIYALLTSIAKGKGAMVIFDADGPLLKNGLKEKPHIIKPNNHELSNLFNIDEKNDKEILKAAHKLREQGIKKVLVSLGERGGYYVTENGVYYAKGLKVDVKSTVGAGDSMVASLVYSIINKFDDIETLRFATACGSATVSLEGTEACTLGQANEYLSQIEVIKL